MSVIKNKQTFSVQPGTSFVTGDAKNNIFYGIGTGNSTLSGTSNIGMGVSTMTSLTTGSSNVAIAGRNTLGAKSTQATISNCVAIGSSTIGNIVNGAAGGTQVCIGQNAGLQLTTSSIANTYIGDRSGNAMSSGANNVGIGSNADASTSTSSSSSTLIGISTNGANFSSSTGFGFNCTVTASNQIQLGSSGRYVYLPGTGANGSAVFAGAVNSSIAKTTVNGSTSGTIICSQPFQGSSFKKVVIYCNAVNGTASYTYPLAFAMAPQSNLDSALTGVTLSSLTNIAVTVSGVGTGSGFIILQGQ